MTPGRALVLLLALIALTLAACRGTASPASTPSAAPSTTALAFTATPEASPVVGPTEPSGELAFQHVQELAGTIGPRPAGSEAEARAAGYIADQLRSYGYTVEEQTFGFTSEVGLLDGSFEVLSPEPQTIEASALTGSGAYYVTGKLVYAGLGRPNDFPPEGMSGGIALLRRGELYFADKVHNAGAAGAGAAVIFNDSPGLFEGDLGEEAAIAAISISGADGERLVGLLSSGPVEATVSVGVRMSVGGGAEPSVEAGPAAQRTSRNVIARPADGRCDTITGAHFDSVPQAPGASDNASGTATVLELARTVAARHLPGDNCFALFGAEELGMLGSAHFVQGLDAAQRQELRGMLNFDMAGVGESWELIGSPELVAATAQAAAGAGITAAPSEKPENVGSDHQSFIDAGIPAVWIWRVTDNLLHTPQDTVDRVQPSQMQEAATIGLLVLEDLDQSP